MEKPTPKPLFGIITQIGFGTCCLNLYFNYKGYGMAITEFQFAQEVQAYVLRTQTCPIVISYESPSKSVATLKRIIQGGSCAPKDFLDGTHPDSLYVMLRTAIDHGAKVVNNG